MMDSAALEISGLSKRFGATTALDGVDLTVRKPEVHAIVGENGAGKSTLMNILSASLRPDSGSILLHGQPYRPADPSRALPLPASFSGRKHLSRRRAAARRLG